MAAPSALSPATTASPRAASSGTEALITWALIALAVGIFFMRWQQQPAGIAAEQGESIELARHLAAGEGPRLTAASTVSVGPPNLVWLGVQVGLAAAGAPLETWLPRLAALLSELGLVLVSLRGAWVWRRAPRVEEALPAVGLAVVTATAEAAALGSGAASFATFVALAAIVLGRGLGTGDGGRIGALIGAMTLFRPSAVWFLFAAVPAWAIAARLEGRRPLPEVARFVAFGLLVVALVFGARFMVFGELPLDGLFPSDVGVERTIEFLGRQARWFWAALTALLFAAVWRRFHLRGGGTLLAWVLTTLVLACWTESSRSLFLGCVPLLAMLISEGLAAARERAMSEPDDRALSRLSWLGLVLTAMLLVLAARSSYSLGLIMPVLGPKAQAPEILEEIKRRGLQQPLIAWSDPVEAASLFPDARVVIIKTPSRALEDLLVTEGPPDLVDGRVVVETMPKLAETITSGPGGARWLVEQSADDDPRCPDGRLALLSDTPEHLLAGLEKDVSDGLTTKALARWRCALSALPVDRLPSLTARTALSAAFAEKSKLLEAQGSLEQAIRVGALSSSLAGEPALARARVERLRVRWLESP